MTQCRSFYVPVMGHDIHVLEWGNPTLPALVMWHGLVRNARDFDVAAAHFADRFRVICPDTIGRGLSSWSGNPDVDYTLPAYCLHALGLLDALGIETCAWVGTSMGGLMGMGLAGTEPGKARITRLVVNDAGPQLNEAAIERIRAYAGMVPEFSTMAEFEGFLRLIYAPFGALSDEEWRKMAQTSVRRRDSGKLSSHYDPQLMRVFAEQYTPLDMWPIYDAITCPTLVLRGESSDLLLAETAAAMTTRGPKAGLVTIPGCGHAPYLNTPDQLAVLDGFLLEGIN
ncbi:MAG: alpha/beta hydrolase [Alphaproteobacteria bacterium]|nr:alpha/beta hydrolase [Alphaproteobacteria bacterium]